ncbi:hypothetical protein DYB31_009835, partial [Aphanomyces astaci]
HVLERQDSVDVVDWITRQPWSNGRVGLWGMSYEATAAYLTVSTHHPAIKACVPMYMFYDMYNDIASPATFTGAIEYFTLGDNTWRVATSWPPSHTTRRDFFLSMNDRALVTDVRAIQPGSCTWNVECQRDLGGGQCRAAHAPQDGAGGSRSRQSSPTYLLDPVPHNPDPDVPRHSFYERDRRPIPTCTKVMFGLLPIAFQAPRKARLQVRICGHDAKHFTQVDPTRTMELTADATTCVSSLSLPILETPPL